MENGGKERREFKVVLEGVELTDEQERSIRQGIQQVVASQLAELDFGGDAGAAILAIGGHEGTQGIIGRPIDPGEADEMRRLL